MDADHWSATRLEATLVAESPVGVVGGLLFAGNGLKTAATAYQSVDADRLAVPCWLPAALEVMSDSSSEPLSALTRVV